MSEPGLPDTLSLTKVQLSERKAVIATIRLWSIFSVAVLVNYPWELAQARLYVGTDGADIAPWLCIVASLVDSALVLLIYAVGVVLFSQRGWFVAPGFSGYALMAAAGFLISISMEWITVYGTRIWAYSPNMPLVPGLGIGVAPLAQMLLLPPLIFYFVAAWHSRGRSGVTDPSEPCSDAMSR